MIPIAGYPDRWSVGQEETIEFKVSSVFDQPCSVKLVKIICADPNPDGPGIIEKDLSSVFSSEFPSRVQDIQLGSYAEVQVQHKLPHLAKYSIVANIWPTLLGDEQQTILSFVNEHGMSIIDLGINRSKFLTATIANSESERMTFEDTGCELHERRWYTVWLEVDTERDSICLGMSMMEQEYDLIDEGYSIFRGEALPSLTEVDRLLIAASGDRGLFEFFNGKIEMPAILNVAPKLEFEPEKILVPEPTIGELRTNPAYIVSKWDFSEGISTQQISDVGKLGLDGRLVNCPTRAMRGSNWTGSEMCWRHVPEEYGAIHFHDDDIYDCGWETDFTFKVPIGFRSGMYSMRIECEDTYEDIPFYIRPPTGKPQSDICVLISTFTYTVYTNQSRSIAGEDYEKLVNERGTRPWNPDQVQDYGLSTYNFHHDGSGICYSSRLRPSLTMRPNYITICRPYGGSGMRHLPADTHLLAWLDHFGYEFDVVTDDDLHDEGYELLEPYRVVMTCSHPEYHTRNTLDAIYRYSRSGGRLMYMGGNGFYWKVAVNEELPGMVEIRRGEGGIRIWAAEPGEYYNALDGEYGGLWLRNGRPPQKLAGVGFTAQGDFQGTYYRRNPNIPSDYHWVFEGIDDEILGDFGLSGGGAAGFELDRVDPMLGTPNSTIVLASSETYPDHFVLVPEEWLSHVATRSGEPASELIRSDIVIVETHDGGWVFSVGSISYCGALPWNGFDNNISKLTANVLNEFLDEYREFKPAVTTEIRSLNCSGFAGRGVTKKSKVFKWRENHAKKQQT